MRSIGIGAALACVAVAAHGQTSGWGAFEAGEGAGVGIQNADGSQLMLQCSKPGEQQVFATVVTKESLVPPADSFVMRPVSVRFDASAPFDDSWRFYDHSVLAVNAGSERSLSRLMGRLSDAKTLELRLQPGRRSPVTIKFDVSGAKEAIAHVYESCKDKIPTG